MSVDENKALIRQFYEEVWDKGNSDFAFGVFADDYVRHDLRPTAALPGPAGQKNDERSEDEDVAKRRPQEADGERALRAR